MRKKEILALVLMGCEWIFCGLTWAARHKKLPPLTPAQVAEVVQKLRAGQLNFALIFDLKTTSGKKSITKEGKFFAQQKSSKTNLRFDFGEQSFWALGKIDDEIFCSKNSPKIGLNDPLLPGHLLNFSDILMPFLHSSAAEYRCERRVLGRNVHIIRFKETAERSIDIAYDPKFEAILQVEHFDGQGNLMRTFKLLDFKKAQSEWLMKTIEIRDVASATTSRLTVKKVAVGQPIPASIFDINFLEKSARFGINFLKRPVKIGIKLPEKPVKFNVNILKKSVKVSIKLLKKSTEVPLIYIDF